MRSLFGTVASGAAGVAAGIVAARLGQTNTNNIDQTSYSTGTFTPTASGRLVLIAATHAGTATVAAATSVTGASITGAVVVASVTHNSGVNRTEIWRASTTASAGAVTILFPATATGCIFGVYEFTNVNNGVGSNGVVQSATASGTGTAYSVTLAAFGDSRNATFAAFGTAGNANPVAPKAGWTELHDAGITSPFMSHETQFIITNDTTPQATNTGSANWGGVAVEIASS